jgi:hypothetical protein
MNEWCIDADGKLDNRVYADELDFESTERAWQYWGIGLFALFALVQTALFLSMLVYRWALIHRAY